MRALRVAATADKVGVHPMTIRRWATEDRYNKLGFPRPIKLGDNSIAFIEEEIESWLERRAAERDEALAS